jgi:hypothetical protein
MQRSSLLGPDHEISLFVICVSQEKDWKREKNVEKPNFFSENSIFDFFF